MEIETTITIKLIRNLDYDFDPTCSVWKNTQVNKVQGIWAKSETSDELMQKFDNEKDAIKFAVDTYFNWNESSLDIGAVIKLEINL